MTLSLRLIEQAIVLGQTGNFARAAERLGLTQPTLSRNMVSLESSLGVRLFDRGRGGAALTVFGRVVMERGAALVRDANALQAELHAIAGLETGHLHIAAGPYVAEDLVGPAVARLINESPGLRVRVTVVSPDEIGAELLSGRHELGLGGFESQLPHEALSVEPLKERRLFLACRPGHPLAGQRPTLAQVLVHPLVTVIMHGRAARAVAPGSNAGTQDARRKGMVPAIEVNSLDTAKRIAHGSDALFPGSATMLAAALHAGDLVTVQFDSPELRATPALVRLRDRTPSPASIRFVELLREVESELLATEGWLAAAGDAAAAEAMAPAP